MGSINVKIEKLVYGGEGLAHSDGATFFVPFVLPGETVSAKPVERKKKFVRARLCEVLAPSSERAVPPCPHFTVCGGCQYQHISYEAQLRLKTEILRETLWRIGRIRWDGPIQTHPSPPLGYRNRAQWKVRPQGNPSGTSAKLAIGYFRAGSTALCPVNECPILSPRLEQALGQLRELLSAGEMPAMLRGVEAFVDESDHKLLLNASLVNFPSSPATLTGKFRSALPGLETVLLHESSRDRMELDGPGFIHYRAAGTAYRVGHLSFFQVNRFLIDDMVHAVTAGEQGQLGLDLFAGVGLFALALGPRFERLVAVEADSAAARDLEANAQASSAAAEAVNKDAERFLRTWSETPDLVVLDPPRAGVPAPALGRLTELRPARISYVSCDPSTLARDLAVLVAAGYVISEAHLFDVFPQTFHIESLVRLARSQ